MAPAPPWNTWTLDTEFLARLDEWTRKNPTDNKLGTVLEKVCKAIEAAEPWMGLIPDSPFPARSLIQGLAAVVKLGKEVKKAKKDAQKFAQDTVNWITDILKAFQQVDGGRSTTRTWDNLDSVRALVEEVCKWADDRLKEKWWSTVKNKITQDEGIEQFKSQLLEAKSTFMQLSMINNSQTLDLILKTIDMLRKEFQQAEEKTQGDRNKEFQYFQSQLAEAANSFQQSSNMSQAENLISKGISMLQKENEQAHKKTHQTIHKAHQEIQMAHQETIDKILEQMQNLTEEIQEKRCDQELAFIKQRLDPYNAVNSGYEKQNKGFCYSGTRKKPLEEIKEWVSDLSKEAKHFLWLTGEPGAGKSTITATVCRDLRNSDHLGAQFFINRNNQTTTNPTSFFPSIALQLAAQSSEIAHAIYLALRENPTLADEVNKALAEKLFAEPLRSMSSTQVIVVVVDALDESNNVKLLANVLSKVTNCLGANAKVFFSSRAENVIGTSWNAAPDTKHLSIGTDSSTEDVDFFIRQKLQEIAETYELGEWPEESVQELCHQASGLFIWATTAVAYIENQVGPKGPAYVLDQLNGKDMSKINELYGLILDTMYRGQKDSWLFETFRRIVGAIAVLNTPFSIGILVKILDLQIPAGSPDAYILHFVRQLRTVLVAGTDEITLETIPRLHKSFFEYVTSEDIKPERKVSLLVSHKELASKCHNYYRKHGKVGNPYFQAARSSYQWLFKNLDKDPDFVPYLLNFGDLEYSNYLDCDEVTSLDTSISIFTHVTKLASDDHPEKPRYLSRLGTVYHSRYQRLGDLTDLDCALQNLREAVSLTPQALDRPGHLKGLANSFRDRYRRLGDVQDLEEALQLTQEAVDLTPVEHINRASYLQTLSDSFRDRYRRSADLKDLEIAFHSIEEAVALTPKGHPDQLGILQSQAACFRERYKRLGSLQDLERALQLHQQGVNSTPEWHLQRPAGLQSLADSFRDRYQRLGDQKDLDAALKRNQEAVDLTPEGHPDRAERLNGLAVLLADRYRQLGDLNDLEAAVHRNQEAVDLTPDGHPDRAGRLQSLAVPLADRYRRLGDLNDLEAALQRNQEAVVLTPEGHPDRAERLHGLAGSFADRYRRLGDLDDLEAALQRSQEAVDLTPEGHPDRAERLHGLAVRLADRYRQLGDLNDLEAALHRNQDAVDLTPYGHPDKAGRLQSLAVSFTDRYQQLGDLNDLEAAVQRNQEAVDLTPDGHPDRAGRLQSLAVSFTDRYRNLNRLDDLESVNTHYTASFAISTSTPENSWSAALNWASVSSEFKSADCITPYLNAFRLLPEILWIGNMLSVRHEAIYRLRIEQVTSAAAKACIDSLSLTSAVEILEQGLGITYQQMLQLKTDLFPILPLDQAKDFQFLSSELYFGTFPDRRIVAIQRQNLLKVIRQQPGFEYFLLSKPYQALCHASWGGPVVILNSHQDHCDGIIILDPASDPEHIRFPNVTLDQLKTQREGLTQLQSREGFKFKPHREGFEFKTREECFADRLAWLWTHIVEPVCQVLQFHGIHGGRLWWLPTGAFTGLPLHACSPTDKFIHSYTATLGQLLEGYSKKSPAFPRVGVVGATLGQQNYLQGVEKEVRNICSIIAPHQIECLVGERATVDAVRYQLQKCSWVHLACDGVQDLVDPTKSRLLLYDGNLEMEAILRMPLSNAEFVFLSAPQTAMGDAKLVNESFHLGGGFIAAGFRGAIGTMWSSMNDSDFALVAEIFYSHLFRDGRQPQASDAAEALQLAIKELRARGVPYERWIPFIHMGV